MSTTIDSLEIQIQTSAGTSAAKIQELAGALGELKKGSKIDTVVKNLGNLNEVLSTLNTHHFSKLTSISKSLQSLSGLENIKISSTIAKQIGEIARITSSIGGDDLGKINGMAKSLAGLQSVGSVKISSTIAKQLQEISNVAAQTDMGKFRQFATEIGRLAEALDPLGAKIGNIAKSFDKLPPKINKAVSAADNMTKATKNMNGELNTSSLNIMSMIHNFNEMHHAAQTVIHAMSAVLSDAIEWDGIQYRFGRAFGEDAEEVYTYVQKVNEALGINIQQFMQYSSLYGSLLSGFGLAQEKVTTISVGLTELSYDIWAAYNDRFKTLEDASEAVRSAITGEIEPIRNAGIALTEASLQEFADNYDHAAMAANDTKTALEEVFEAANTGELEPLRKMGVVLEDVESQAEEASNSIVDMVTNGVGDSALQATADRLGLGVSVEKLTEAQKSELRYATMMNAAMNQGIIGTYASEMETAEGAVRNLSQTLKTLTQAFGSLFIPILQLVIPYLSAFVELLIEAVHWVAAFFGITLFEIDWGSSVGGMASGLEHAAVGADKLGSGLKDAAVGADKLGSGLGGAAAAAKKLKDYTLGFDELNVISPPSESGGGAGGGAGAGAGGDSGRGDGLDLDTLWDDSLFAKASKQVDELKQKIKDWFEEWKTEITIIGTALSVLSVASLLESLGKAIGLGDEFLGKVNGIKQLAAVAIVLTIQYSLMSEFLQNFIETGEWEDYVWAAVVGALGAFGSYLIWGKKGLVLSLGITALASLDATFEDGSIDSWQEVVTGLTGLASGAAALGMAWPKVKPFFDGTIDFFRAAKQMAPDVGWLAALFPKLATGLASVGAWFSSLGAWIAGAATAVGTFIAGITLPVWGIIAAVIAALSSVIIFLKRNWEEVTQVVKDFFATNIAPKLETIKEHFSKMKEAVSGVFAPFLKIIGVVGNLGTALKELEIGRKILEFIGKTFEVVGGIIFGVVGGVIAGVFNAIVSVIENVIQIFSGCVQIISGAVEAIVKLFTGDFQGAWEAVKKIGSGIVEVFVALPSLIFDAVEEFIAGILGFFTELWDELVGHSIVPDTIDAIVEWFLSLPGKIFKPVKDFADGIVKRFKDLWTNVKTWYQSKVAPKFTLSYWQGVFKNIGEGLSDKLEDAWEAVKDFFDPEEWKKKVVDAIDAIKENFKIPELPKIKLEVTYSADVGKAKKLVYEALGLSGWPSLKWSTYATGGFPSMGQMFIANEAGPELVGNIGSRTAVVNNDQIVAAVSQGVYSAVVAAMSASNGNSGQNVNVYLDGKQIYASVKRTEAERGVSLMGNQLGYSY